VFATRSLNVTPKTIEQNLIARSGKSEAEVTDRHEASCGLCATAELLVSHKSCLSKLHCTLRTPYDFTVFTTVRHFPSRIIIPAPGQLPSPLRTFPRLLKRKFQNWR